MFGLTELNICRMSAKFLQVQELPGSVGKGFPAEEQSDGEAPQLCLQVRAVRGSFSSPPQQPGLLTQNELLGLCREEEAEFQGMSLSLVHGTVTRQGCSSRSSRFSRHLSLSV